MQEKKIWIYDIEQMINFHSIVFIDRDSDEKHYFVVHYLKNDIIQYMNFLKTRVKGLIGFNNLNYDYPVLHHLIDYCSSGKDLDGHVINKYLYQKSQEIVNAQYSAIKEKDVYIPQIDLFKIHHFDNKAKRTSLKWIEGVMKMDNVYDMPIHYTTEIHNLDDIKSILSYNLYDVKATKLLYQFTIPDIELRKNIIKEYKINALNFSDSKIGEELMLHSLAESYNVDKSVIKEAKSNLKVIRLKDVILPNVEFKIQEFKELLKFYKNKTLSVPLEKGVIEKKFNYRKVEYKFGIGGIHASVKNRIYNKSAVKIIKDVDVGSFYPALSIINRFYPIHLGESYCDVYEEKYKYRLSIKSIKEMKFIAGMWKLALNGTFGKTNDVYSFLYDPSYTLKTTVNGQLLILMFIEKILLNIRSAELIQANTDGVTFYLDKLEEEHFDKLCKEYEEFTKFTLEYTYYKKMVVRDVNSYLAVKDKPEEELYPEFPESNWYDNFYTKHKTKGYFEVVKTANGRIAFNKKWGKTIIPKALYNYFVYDIPVHKTVMESKDILDFCDFYKEQNTEKAQFISQYYENNKKPIRVSKLVRYYCSVGGGKLYKLDKLSNKIYNIEKDSTVTIFNKKINLPMSEYNINYSYYINECNETINKLKRILNENQLKLNF